MAWDHLSINRPHLVYIILGGFTSLFMLCSSFIKERLYIGEATVATICGVIFGPHAANLIDPGTWGNTDQVTLEFSRIVLVVQCFAVGVELPKYYMEKHWRSVVFLLIPVMTFGWLITSLFIWWMVPPLSWLESLCVAACVTATDPVLASSVVGKGKFAKRVPKHLRDLLSAESGCNDGMAFPFIYLALYLIDYRPDSDAVAEHWIVLTILYECVFGAIYGFLIGYIGRHGIKYAERHDLVDRESFLVFYFVLALFCAGSGSILGVDDLLVGFAAGVGFSNDGWFTQKTEESHVSNVIDLLINLAYFVYLGTIIPWEQYNSPALGLTPWRLVVIAIFVILFRRIPIMMALKPLIPDIKTWREALFAGHFGPIGVGAIFVAILARAELETHSTTPLASYPDPSAENYVLVGLIWPITTFLVIASIIVHGSSIAVFTLGKHINTLTLTMSYTTGGEDGPSWMNRLPRISSQSRSMAKANAEGVDTDGEDIHGEDVPPGSLPPIGMPKEFLRRQKEEDRGSRASSMISRRRKKRWDERGPGGPIQESAIRPQRRSQSGSTTLTPGDGSPNSEKDDDDLSQERDLGEVQHDPEMEEIMHRDDDEEKYDQHRSDAERYPNRVEVYDEGDDVIIENEDGEVISTQQTPVGKAREQEMEDMGKEVKDDLEHPSHAYKNLRKKLGVWMHKDDVDPEGKPKVPKQAERKRGPALAYQFGNTIIVEDEDGEVVKKYELPSQRSGQKSKEDNKESTVRKGLDRAGTWIGQAPKKPGQEKAETNPNQSSPAAGAETAVRQGLSRMGTWGFGGSSKVAPPEREQEKEEEDDRRIRFTIGGAGRRLTKDDFLKEIQSLDPKARSEILESSDAPAAMKDMARKDASNDSPGSSRLFGAKAVQTAAGPKEAKGVGAEMARRRGADVRADGDDSDKAESSFSSSSSSQTRERKPTTRARSNLTKVDSPSHDEPETAAERRRRAGALKGVAERKPAQESRGRSPVDETPAEKRRREAALGSSGAPDEDSDDDDTPRVPAPKSRGIRFAQSPVRGKK
ncbi:putative Na(+) antiporter 1 [Coleophoma crateriformis]|uniref:Putative Na(+) antiporter 1 n=1 Tax=Coleophoma crateriformis TaxID=565419 RepID=A0A3D8T870_9HELO|nr:putative Na(+) antiporter 1 [Coleophoma crateriformis]